jgi:hypothetical protein
MSRRRRYLKSSLIFISTVFISCQAISQTVQFIPNKNQWQADIQFISRIPGGHMILQPGAFAYHFVDYEKMEQLHHAQHDPGPDAGQEMDPSVREHLVRVTFPGANLSSVPETSGETAEYYNFYSGNDSCRWVSGVHGYDRVSYPGFYNGIDLRIYSSGQHVKYDFIVSAEADPSSITMRYDGADRLRLENGNLYATTSLSEVIEKKPYAFQRKGNEEIGVACEFSLSGQCVSFVFPDGYDPCYELVIDPLLIFSTYSGSTADNWGSTATPGEHGRLYSAGVTSNYTIGSRFPTTTGAYQTSNAGGWDIGILKYDSTGRSLLYATHLGGTSTESAHSLIVDSNNDLVVLGTTGSSAFPTTAGAFDRTFNGGPGTGVIGLGYAAGSDIVIARFNAAGTTLLASTFLGGNDNDGINIFEGPLVRNYGDELRGDVITDAEGNIYLSTVTSSVDFPGLTGFDTTMNGGGTDGLVLKMSPDLSQILWGTFVGGTGADACYSIKLDSAKNIFVAGGTTSGDFPVTTGAHMETIQGDADGWICKLSSDGSTVLHGTFTGTRAYDQVYFLDLNRDEEVYVYGQTSGDFEIFPSDVYRNPSSGQFVQKFSNTLGSVMFSTVFGSGRGDPDISPTAFLVNDCNNLYMTGWGGGVNRRHGYWTTFPSTLGMPVTNDAFQGTTSGNDFYFIVLADDAKTFLYGTYLGGTKSLTHVDGGTSRFDKSGVVYHAVCSGCNTDGLGPKSDFPTTVGAWSRVNRSVNCNNAAFKFDLSSLRALIQTNSVDYQMPGLQFVCIPDTIRFQNKSIGGETYEWDLGDGTTTTATDTSSVLHRYQNEGKYLVRMKAIDLGTCKVVDSTAVYVTVFRKNMVVGPDTKLCEGSSHTLFASGGVSYEWTSDDPAFGSEAATTVVSPHDTTRYYVKVTDLNGCILRDTVDLTVIPKIVPQFTVTREKDCSEPPYVTLGNVTDSLMVGDEMVFDLGDGNTSTEKDFDHQFETQGVYRITLRTQREFCVYERSSDVPLFKLKIPNVITPQGSKGMNDVFFVQYGDDHIGPYDYGFKTSVLIYNRWGRVVYENHDYRNDWSAAELPAGVYYYEVTVADHATCRDWLHIVR